MNNQIIINLKEDGTIKNIETTKEQELQSIIKFKVDCLNEYADRINKAIEYIENCEWEDYPIQTTTHHKLKEEIIGKVLLNILRGEE